MLPCLVSEAILKYLYVSQKCFKELLFSADILFIPGVCAGSLPKMKKILGIT